MQLTSRGQALDNDMNTSWTTLDVDDASTENRFGTGVPGFSSTDFLSFPELNFTAPSPSPYNATSELQRFRQLAPPSVWCTSLSEYLEAMESSLNAYVQYLGGNASEKVYDNPYETRPCF
jgi:hypothetical protein